MGLDGVELVMDVEETFGVAIPDALAQNMRTVDDLYQFLLSQCTGDRESDCLTGIAFYQLRQGLCQTLCVERHDVRPVTRIDELVGGSSYQQFWTRLRQSMVTLRLPSLGRPSWLSHFVVHSRDSAILLAAASMPVLYFAANYIGWLIVPAIVGEMAFIAVFLTVAEPIARSLPRDFQTVGDLAQLVLKRNRAWFAARQKTWDENRIWSVLQETISKTLNVKISDITPQSRFVDDLGVG